jgi:hypothetical protein
MLLPHQQSAVEKPWLTCHNISLGHLRAFKKEEKKREGSKSRKGDGKRTVPKNT